MTCASKDRAEFNAFLRVLEPVFNSFGAHHLESDGQVDTSPDGQECFVQITAFPDINSARAGLASEEYAATDSLRSRLTDFDVVVIEQATF
jgi:uncharacterized protein (DUF1330 family)